jgi:hypothetical protein
MKRQQKEQIILKVNVHNMVTAESLFGKNKNANIFQSGVYSTSACILLNNRATQ